MLNMNNAHEAETDGLIPVTTPSSIHRKKPLCLTLMAVMDFATI